MPYQQLEIPGFTIALANFEGPFDLLLQLINSKKLDVTEVALSQVTDEFISYTRSLTQAQNEQAGQSQDTLEQRTEFLLIAATLLDLKAARLLPQGEVDNEADLALLEARDLLFAKLLQYKAYKEVASLFAAWQRQAQRSYPRDVALEESFLGLLPPVDLGMDVHGFASLAAEVFTPKTVNVEHIHQSPVSVPKQAHIILAQLQSLGAHHFISLDSIFISCEDRLTLVARFLALLQLYKDRYIELDDRDWVAWTGIEKDIDSKEMDNYDS